MRCMCVRCMCEVHVCEVHVCVVHVCEVHVCEVHMVRDMRVRCMCVKSFNNQCLSYISLADHVITTKSRAMYSYIDPQGDIQNSTIYNT